MPSIAFLITIFFPFVAGAIMPILKLGSGKAMKTYVFSVTLLTSLFVFALLIFPPTEHISFALSFGGLSSSISFEVGLDGLSKIFAVLIAVLWPFSVLYAFEYMEHDKFQPFFFVFYTVTYGVTLGIAFSANLFTLYIFYEFLTLCTLPLVMHGFKDKSIKAGRKYMYYSLGGSAFAFVGLIYIIHYAGTTDFVPGGIFTDGTPLNLQIVYLMTFMGFGVKAAAFPVHDWLPTASVAPTPVTALLHAVAVVKSGAFAIIRTTYYCFGTENLKGTWVQYTVIAIAIITIIFGSSMALKENHFKRRLAYSTVGNLSYILLAATLMSPAGLAAALMHMLAHGITKIVSFFAAGAILHKTGKEYVDELDGIGKKMPFTCACYVISALSLVGIPPLAGFISKWSICTAAAESESVAGYLGLAAILISAILTGIYMFTPVIRMYANKGCEDIAEKCDPGPFMKITLAVISVAIVLFGIFAAPISELIQEMIIGV